MTYSILSLSALTFFGIAITQTGIAQWCYIGGGFMLLVGAWTMLAIDVIELLSKKPMTKAEMIAETMDRR